MSEPLTMRVVLAPGRVLCAVDARGMPLPRYVGFYDAGRTPMPEGERVAADEGPDGGLRPTQALYAGAFGSGSLLEWQPPAAPATDAPAEAAHTTLPGLPAPTAEPPSAPADAGKQVQ